VRLSQTHFQQLSQERTGLTISSGVQSHNIRTERIPFRFRNLNFVPENPGVVGKVFQPLLNAPKTVTPGQTLVDKQKQPIFNRESELEAFLKYHLTKIL
jgi:hypothetical protein